MMLTNTALQQEIDLLSQTFLNTGTSILGPVIDSQPCKVLSQAVRSNRKFGLDLFLDETAFRANPQYNRVNPGPGICNLAESYDLDFIEKNTVVQFLLTELLGDGYKIMLKKFVCGCPKEWIPAWVQQETKNFPVANLGPYIKPEYRDITYFSGIDYHQDIIDFKGRLGDFITLYVYIEEVTPTDSPLYVVPGSHQFGATVFPHQLTFLKDGKLRYEDGHGQAADLDKVLLTGPAGSVSLWHNCSLHGTQPALSTQGRLSLRYLIERSKSSQKALIDEVNANIKGPLTVQVTRVDVTDQGEQLLRQNLINQDRPNV